MFCKYCGMESTTNDKCSWCHKTLATTAPVAMPPAPTVAEVPQPESVAPLATAEMEAIVEPPVPQSPVAPTPPAPVAPATRPSIGVRRPTAPPVVSQTSLPTPSAPPPPAAATPPPSAPKPQAPATAQTMPPAPAKPSAPSTVPRPLAPVMAPAPSAYKQSAKPESTSPPPSVTSRPKAPVAQPLTSATPPAQVSQPVGVKRPAAPVAKPVSSVPTASAATTTMAGLAEGVAKNARTASPPASYVPELGTVTTVKSKYYQDVVIDPVSGTHYDLMTSKPMNSHNANEGTTALKPERELIVHYIDEDEENTSLLLRYGVAFLGILLITYYIVGLAPPIYWLALMLCNVSSGMLLPVLKVAPWQDEDSDDIGWLFLGTLIGGPVVAFIIYGILSLMRREFNAGVLGCLGVSVLSRLTVEIAAGSPTLNSIFVPWGVGHLNFTTFAVGWAGLVTMLGWIVANIFHQLDE